MYKKIISLTLSAALLLGSGVLSEGSAGKMTSAITITAEAADPVIYNGDTMTEFSSRTAKSVAQKYTDAYYAGKSYNDNDPSSYYSSAPSLRSPYSQGTLSSDTLKCMQEMTSFYRWLVGNKPLTVDCVNDPSLQYQALDRNFQFGHTISNSSKPADMSQELWNKGFECKHNILAGGFTPLGAVKGWINEGYHLVDTDSSKIGWTSLGHRAIMLNPDHIDQQFGYCGTIGVGKCDFDTAVSSYQPFYAFPSPGYVPTDCINPAESAWSVGLDLNKIRITNTSNVKVTVTNLKTGTSYTCTKANGKLYFPDELDYIGFVQPNDYNKNENKYESNYKVVITGLTDKATSKAAQIQYTVKFFNVKDYSASTIKKAGLDFEKILIYSDSFDGTDSLKKLGACIPQTISITNEFGNTAKVKTKGEWVLDEANKCWYNSVDPSDVPVKFTDTNGLLKKIKISYAYTDDENCAYNTLTINPSKPAEGASVKFSIFRAYYTKESSLLCQLAKNDNGDYYCKKTYDSQTSPEFDKTNSSGANHYYNIKATAQDSGQYISIYYSTDDYWKEAYVCIMPRTLTVTESEHHFVATKTVAPTCTEQGYTLYTCTSCSQTKKADFVAAKGHNWSGWTTVEQPTCSKQGTQKKTCSVCGESQTQSIATTSHSYTTKTVAPTCTEKGYTLHTCKICGYSFKDSYVTEKGHKWGGWTTVPATVTTAGSKTHTCSVCGKKETETIDKLSLRLAGNDRYETAFKIADRLRSENGGAAFSTIIIASGADFADALSAAYLAKVKNAPILITAPSMTDTVVSYIKKNAAANATIYIIGGNKAVSPQTETKLKGMKIKRLAGSDRFETNIAVLKEAKVTNEEILVASGLNYADALSASAVGKPILLVAGKSLTDKQQKYLSGISSTTATIVGGTAAVSNDIEKQVKKNFKSVSRLGGSDRFATSVLVAKKYFKNPGTLIIASGMNFPDGLCGGPIAMYYKSPLILTVKTDYSAAKAYALSIKATGAVTLGGKTVIPDSTVKGILNK